MYQVQFYPDRIVTTVKRDRPAQPPLEKIACKHLASKKTSHLVKDYPFDIRLQNLRKKKTTGVLSKTSKREIKDSIASLAMLSKPRTVQISQKKFIYNYRASFITLKLPAPQVHSDVELKACVNLLMNNLRSIFDVENYVWKAELQKNENIHFHLVLDKYISYHNLLYYWNKAISHLGYIDTYAEKFLQMSFQEYVDYRSKQDEKYGNDIDINIYRNAYQAGKSSKWRRPNTVSVNNIQHLGQVSRYLAKYLSKANDETTDPERFSKFGKFWSRSRSLSCLKYRNKFDLEEIKDWLKSLKNECSDAVEERFYDYCTVIYVNIKKMSDKFLRYFSKIIWGNAQIYSYPHPS